MSRKIIIGHKDCINEKLIKDFVNTDDGLPILLLNILEEFDSNIETNRYLLYEEFPHLEKLDNQEIEITSKLLKEGKSKEAEEFQIDYALKFLEKYPRFKCMVNVESRFNEDVKIMINSIKEAFLGDFDYF